MYQYSTITARYQHDDGTPYWLAWHPEWECCPALGDSGDDARENLIEVLEMLIEHHKEYNLPIPEPSVWKSGETITVDFGRYV